MEERTRFNDSQGTTRLFRVLGLSFYLSNEEILQTFKGWLKGVNDYSEILTWKCDEPTGTPVSVSGSKIQTVHTEECRGIIDISRFIELWFQYNVKYLNKRLINEFFNVITYLPYETQNRIKLTFIRSKMSPIVFPVINKYLVNKMNFSNHPSIIDIQHEEFVEQMTIVQNSLFRRVTHQQLREKSWMNNTSNEITSLIRLHNWITSFIGTHILMSAPDQNIMVQKIEFAIRAANYAYQINNFELSAAIINGLLNNPIDRLNHVFKRLNESSLAVFELLNNIFVPANNFKNYRDLFGFQRQRCIPYMAVILRDFTGIIDGNPKYITNSSETNQVNLRRLELLGEKWFILESLKGDYQIKETEKMSELLNYHVMSYDELDKISRTFYSAHRDVHIKKINHEDLVKKSVADWNSNEIISWLTYIGLDQYTNYFLDLTGKDMMTLDDSKLVELGIYRSGHRMKLLSQRDQYHLNIKPLSGQLRETILPDLLRESHNDLNKLLSDSDRPRDSRSQSSQSQSKSRSFSMSSESSSKLGI